MFIIIGIGDSDPESTPNPFSGLEDNPEMFSDVTEALFGSNATTVVKMLIAIRDITDVQREALQSGPLDQSSVLSEVSSDMNLVRQIQQTSHYDSIRNASLALHVLATDIGIDGDSQEALCSAVCAVILEDEIGEVFTAADSYVLRQRWNRVFANGFTI